MINKIKGAIRKNKAEAIALLSGKMPAFVYGIKHFKDIPVFCFHSARYPLFEKQLQFLTENGYKTLTADELYERCLDKNYSNNGKEIVITFDDGMASVWTVAYPLLKKYEHKIISFILPGLMKEGAGVGNTIDDVESEQEKVDLANRDYRSEPLCNWQEVEIMHESGVVDFQSHGMNHALVSTSSHIIDFIHPDFDVHHYGNIRIPVYDDGQGVFVRKAVWGHPVYENSPRLSALPRYLDDIRVRVKCNNYVIEHGGKAFFTQQNWRRKMMSVARQCIDELGVAKYELDDQVERALKQEIIDSKKIIDSRLNKEVKHFCYPWFVGSNNSAQILYDAGYVAAHVSVATGFRCAQGINKPTFIKRVQEEYFMALPGKDRQSLIKVFANKIRP